MLLSLRFGFCGVAMGASKSELEVVGDEERERKNGRQGGMGRVSE